jgi:transcriptional regulator with XRE-family HTH domain
MTPEQRLRAGQAIQARLNELQLTVPKLAGKSGVSAATIRSLIKGQRWPGLDTRTELEKALDWKAGEIMRRAVGSRALDSIRDMETYEILAVIDACTDELRRRRLAREAEAQAEV